MLDSSGRIKTAIYTFLKEKFRKSKCSEEGQKVVLGKEKSSVLVTR